MRFLSMVKMNEAKMTPTPKAMMDAINAMVEEAGQGRLRHGAGSGPAADRERHGGCGWLAAS